MAGCYNYVMQQFQSTTSHPLTLSIVVPSYNQAAYLPRTLESILSQRGDFALEVLIIDGGSTDGTLEILKSLDDERVSWISEKDNGQSDAINKGLAKATGDIVTWLNSDDIYCDDALKKVADTFTQNPQARWLIGQCVIIDEQDQPIRQGITRYKNRQLARYTRRRLLRENFISQMSVFWRNDLGKEVGLLNEDLYYTMDYDLWLRMSKVGDPVVLAENLGCFRWYANSKSGKINRKQFDEQYQVASPHLVGDPISRLIHRVNVEKVVWAYRLMRLLGR
ncbi:MAG: glycosyltransferase family 2 protein [Phycisphaeraceae bacterium JB051]